MNTIDIVITVILIIAGISGFLKGVIVQICGIAGLLLGVLLAFRFSGWLAGLLNIGEDWSRILSFIIIVVVVVLVLFLVGKLVRKVVRTVGLGLLDRLGGLVLGVVKWGLLLSLLTGLAVKYMESSSIADPKIITDAKLYTPLEKLGEKLFPYILDAKEKYIDPEIERHENEETESVPRDDIEEPATDTQGSTEEFEPDMQNI